MIPGGAFIIGNSDGIGLALTLELLNRGWRINGFSRSPSPVKHDAYSHTVIPVEDEKFSSLLKSAIEKESADLCVYCAGIGEMLDLSNMNDEEKFLRSILLEWLKRSPV
jgi:NAD(P)-dependent dehydrogenase (short-subunit alcohol dehydrogenase family)